MATFELKALGELPPLIPILLPIVAPSLLRRYHPRGPDDQPEVEHHAQPPELTKHQDEIEPWIRVEREQEPYNQLEASSPGSITTTCSLMAILQD